MQFVNELLDLLQRGIAAIFRFIRLVWGWSEEQILQVPWDNLSALPLWKIILMVVVAAVIIWLVFRALTELIEASQSALIAIATLLSVFVQTLVPVLLAGIAAAGGAWVINNVTF